ncbi:hypothetical protein J2Y54_000451 [Sphingomonas sp. BE123]|jgi:hypothetical protein|uniref:hypothetical protein n=1 Tax=Sphingomonas sp. BE123 TaxID=2817842 RepID=UPI00285F36F6|nr:hypothetical protein [Sphingomonas sp. BE123]MDR6850958.1 hypothetical protein [Sphingomonas sp. BE123]
MKQLKRIGLGLCGFGMVVVLASLALRYAIDEGSADAVLIGGTIAVLVGGVLWLTSSLVRLLKGEVRLRPWDAVKLAFLYFAVFAALRFGAWAIFPEMERDVVKALFLSIFPALVLGFYSTAYRKPA